LGRDFTEIHPYSAVCSVRKMAYPIRRGYFSEMLFPTWQIAKSVNHQSRLTLLALCPKWRLSNKRGRVADGWLGMNND
jgi:hypothetical protein